MIAHTMEDRVKHLDDVLKTETSRLEELQRKVELQEAVVRSFEAAKAILVANYDTNLHDITA